MRVARKSLDNKIVNHEASLIKGRFGGIVYIDAVNTARGTTKKRQPEGCLSFHER